MYQIPATSYAKYIFKRGRHITSCFTLTRDIRTSIVGECWDGEWTCRPPLYCADDTTRHDTTRHNKDEQRSRSVYHWDGHANSVILSRSFGCGRFGAIAFILAAAADLGRRQLIFGSGSFLPRFLLSTSLDRLSLMRGMRSDRVTVRWFGAFA
jgi:hypothetical protein